MTETKIRKIKKNILIFWIYTKYQILTKFVLIFICFPIYKNIIKKLIYATNRVSISSGDYINFLLSKQGFFMLFCTLIILIILVGIDINAFIIMSALIQENRLRLTARNLLVVSIKSLKNFLRPSGLIIMIYTAIVIPLVGFGFGISVTRKLKIPNFIIDVIYKNNLYFSIYIIIILALSALTFIYIFFFHYMIICNESIKNSLKNSYRLIRRHWKSFLKNIIYKIILVYVFIIILLIVLFILIFTSINFIENILFRRFISIFLMLLLSELLTYFTFMYVPIICNEITKLFYEFNKEDGNKVTLKISINAEELDGYLENKVRLRTKLSIAVFITILFLGNLLLSMISAYHFETLFNNDKNVLIVAHRAGGDLAAENSLLGLKRAIDEGVKFSEIDVQRTKDGQYIVNHDPTFNRLCGINKSATDLTMEDIRELRIKDLFNENRESQPVSMLNEFLKEAKGKIGLFIELKGSTADKKMADDIIEMVNKKNMKNSVVLISLDYNLIKYIEEKYPSMYTGYLYFFSFGETKKLKSDYLIMEEQEATESNIEKIHSEGKKAIVWTVNTQESIDRFLNSDVDGVITDYVLDVKKAKIIQKNRSDIEIIIDKIFN